MIHGLGSQRGGPFVQILAADPTGDPATWLDRAAGGTLFIREIEETLSPGFRASCCIICRPAWGKDRDTTARRFG